ncbi:hypothetical protein ACFXDF_27465 [Streptomyces sp. NPDC059426]|uniref:hypothetical protein n=1 Tax=Streptomyces sp. NPDC059426 TaxID=3346827 RepID=UPI00367487BF
MAIDRLIDRRDVHLREKTLWRMLHETLARSEEILGVNEEVPLQLHTRQCPVERRVLGCLLIRQGLDRHQGLRRSTTSIREGRAARSAQVKGREGLAHDLTRMFLNPLSMLNGQPHPGQRPKDVLCGPGCERRVPRRAAATGLYGDGRRPPPVKRPHQSCSNRLFI